MEKKIGTLIKVISSRRNINETTQYDSILLIYRDKDGVKRTRFIDRAEVPYYVIKDKESESAVSPPMFIERDKLVKNTTFSDLLYREIAIKTDSLHYYDRVLTTWGPNSYTMKNLFKHNWLYDTDMDVADRYIAKFHEEFEPDEAYKLHKCYYDIEVDLMPKGWKKDSKGNVGYMGFPDEEMAPVPVNIITLFDEKAKVSHTFVVRNKDNKTLTDFEINIDKFETYLSKKILEEDLIMMNDMKFYFYDDELETIEAFFEKVHEIDPDFMNAWNAAFDVVTLQNRLKRLYGRLKDQERSSYDAMVTTMSDVKYTIQKDAQGQTAYIAPKAYYRAKKHLSFVNRIDDFQVIDGINWMDQMLYYANIRKVSGQKESYALDAIANEELDKEKLEFGPGETIKTLAWTNFTKFAEYNIRR